MVGSHDGMGGSGGGKALVGRGRTGARAGRRTRTAPVALLLAASLPSLCAAADALPGSDQLRWRGTLSQRTLEDGSVLNEYVTRTGATDEFDLSLSVGFVPRFDCSPLIGIRVVGPLAGSVGAELTDGAVATLAIDGETLEIPLLVDGSESVTGLWADLAADSRERFRRRLDAGSRAELVLPGGVSATFSLRGSRRSLAATQAACRAHEPQPYGN